MSQGRAAEQALPELRSGYSWRMVALAPLLLAQGLHVRRRIPRLPEPEGERSGCAGQGRPLRLLITGDSAAAGVGVGHQEQALSGQLVQQLAGDFQVSWRLLAQSGFTTAQIIECLRAAPVERFDVAVISIGVNDVTAGVGVRTWLARQQQLLTLLGERFQVEHVLFSSLPPMHLFPALPQPLRWFLGSRARHFNHAIAQYLQGHGQGELICPDLHGLTTASDGFHPGDASYAAWARRLADVIRARLPDTHSR